MKIKTKRIAAMILAAVMLFGVSFSVARCCYIKSRPSGSEEDANAYPTEVFESGVYNPVKTEYAAEYLGTISRRIPETSDGGLERYPQYGVTLSDATQEEKSAILAENAALCASENTYDGMDEEGNLYLGGVATGKKLYRHTAADGMYEGNVRDDERAVIKRITMRSRPAGNHITGLYAPAGEPIKIELSEEDLKTTGGLVVYIGQALQNGQANNIWAARDFNRMPVILNSMTAKEEISYVGSYFGGPIYVRSVNAGVKFTVTISGAVPYAHYIYGYTTKEEFELCKESSAPYFDMEVWDDSVRHSGPRARAARFDYEQISSAAVLWDKISRVSNQVPSGSNAAIGITFLYDPFVAAGGMVAFVGRSTVNCPLYCMTAALDVESAVNDAPDAFWGCIHEYNHHYQRYGFAPGDEVTNNAVSLVSYSLYTRNSANRAIGNANEGNYAVGWDRYTNPSWTLKQTLANTGTNSALDGYANLLHAFGATRYLQMTKNGNGSGGADVWYKAVSDATHYDMTYYFTEVLHQTVSENVLSEYAAKDYPVFVPVAAIYQTGRSYTADGVKYYSRTAQPYEIETGENFEIDLNSNLVLPGGFSWRVKNISQPAYGKITEKSDGVYTYIPDEANRESGKIVVTLEITKDDGAFETEDTDIVIELRQKQYKPTMLERTVYTYTDANMYQSPVTAAENDYAGYESVREEDNENPTQNANTDIWVPNPTKNAIMEVRGKFRIESAGKYRLAIRGRYYAALYVSFDGQSYELAADMTNPANDVKFDQTNENNYKDYMFSKGQWVYFKEVLLITSDRSFVGLGIGMFDGDNVNVSCLNAYRNSYYKEEFDSDYFYSRNYTYNYREESGKQTLISANYRPWDNTKPIDLLFDEDDTNWIHSDRSDISADNPFEITVDLGDTMRANRFTIYGEPTRQYQPKDFVLYGGTDPENMEPIATVTNSVRENNNVAADFAEREIRYYKLVVTDTWAIGQNYRYIAFRCAKFSLFYDGGTLLSPDENIFAYKGGWKLSNRFSTFGHLYEGENATAEFTFTGSRFAIFSCEAEDFDSFEILIDGETAGTAKIDGSGNDTKMAYLSDTLAEGEHRVTIRSKTRFNIDSVVLWKTATNEEERR